jgi:hypothetical protein
MRGGMDLCSLGKAAIRRKRNHPCPLLEGRRGTVTVSGTTRKMIVAKK